MPLDYKYHYSKWQGGASFDCSAVAPYYIRLFGSHLPKDRHARILDVGCGSGGAICALKTMGYTQVAGLEQDDAQAASARKLGIDVAVTRDSTAWLLQNSGKFDSLLCFDVLEHVMQDQQLRFAEALRTALTRGGVLIGTTPNANASLAGRYRYIDLTHQTSFTEHSVSMLFHSAGFTNIQISEAEYFAPPRLRILPIKAALQYYAMRAFRLVRRIEMCAELGRRQGISVPLSLNLLFVAEA